MKKPVILLAAFAAIATLSPTQSFACACGCGVFDIGTSAMLPTEPGGIAWMEYDFMNQSKNWHENSKSDPANNDDKDIKTSFMSVGARYMFTRAWGAEISVPYWQRHFTTTDDTTGDIVRFDHSAVGDVRMKAVYSGFSGDMSSGLTFGFKLPTGEYSYHGFDRDTQIGTGSTDVLLGAYHTGTLAKMWNWFASGELDQPFLTTSGYRPGSEVSAITGVYYNGWNIGNVRIAPVAQIIGSYRQHDRGMASDRDNSGYERVVFSPGVELHISDVRVYADVGLPVYQHVRGNQLTAPELFKINISRRF